jgi:hypothetical protein
VRGQGAIRRSTGRQAQVEDRQPLLLAHIRCSSPEAKSRPGNAFRDAFVQEGWLANQLGIGREEAGAYIKKYFERFPGIRDYMEATKETCRAQGYVTTLFGRKMHYPEIKVKNPSLRSFNERAAINARLKAPPPTSSAAP